MTAQEKMPEHPRLYRRGAVCYHRAAVPQDIVETYGKVEETFSLRTKEHAEALIRVRIAAVKVDERFAGHRRALQRNWSLEAMSPAGDLTPAQIARAKAAYLPHLLEEDEGVRLDGFEALDDPSESIVYALRPTFKEYQELGPDMDEVMRTARSRTSG